MKFEEKDAGSTIRIELNDPFDFTIKQTKDSLRILATNLTTKFKYVLLLKKEVLKKNGVRKSLKGINKLLINGLSKLDSHLSVQVYFTPKEGVEESDGFNPASTFQIVEEFEKPMSSRDSAENGDNLYLYLVYQSDYDESDEYLFKFNEIAEDDADRLRAMARDRKSENEDLEKRIKQLENQLGEKTDLSYFLHLKVKVLKEYIKHGNHNLDRKLLKRVAKQLVEYKDEAEYMKRTSFVKDLFKQIELCNRLLTSKKDLLPSGFEDTEILDDEWQDLLLEWSGEEKAQCTLIFKASRDGSSASSFHSKCDGKKKTFVVVKTTNGSVFGGYNPHAWASSNTYAQKDPKAFLFSLKNPSNKQPMKLANQGQYNQYGAYNGSSYGPTFGGGHDLYICNNFMTNSNYSNLGYSYTLPGFTYGQQNTKSYLAGAYNFTVAKLEIHMISEE